MSDDLDRIFEAARTVHIAEELLRRGITLRRSGAEFEGPCPKCGGTDRFSFHPGKAVWNCRGCKPEAIAGDIIGLVMWLDHCDAVEAAKRLSGENGPPRPREARTGGNGADRHQDSPPRKTRPREPLGAILNEYNYPDLSGVLCYQVLRYANKEFRQRRPDGNGGWINSTKDLVMLPYKLTELVEAIASGHPVVIVEGEKDVDTAVDQYGIPATTNPRGAGKFTAELVHWFVGADVVIVADNDEPGIKHANDVAQKLTGTAERIRLLDLGKEWPECPPKGDLTDFFRANHTAAQFWEIAERLPDWAPPVCWTTHALYSTGKSPKLLAVVENACLALEYDPIFTGLLSFNEMAQQTVMNGSGRFLTDDDVTDIQRELQRLGLKNLGEKIAAQAIDNIARDHAFHPLRSWLKNLPWDGGKRIDGWLTTYLGVTDSEYTRKIGRLFLISMIARIFKPGCKADYMLILEGPQGKEKSKACAALAGDEFFSDHLPELSNAKDVSVHLRGKWLIEVPELHAFSRAESTLLKSFLSRQRELYRPPYGKLDVDEPRQCVFIGTSNKDAYLRDETGGRRFWPAKCGVIEIEALKTDRAHLLAEAVHAFRGGEQWWPEHDFEEKFIKPQQDERFEHDTWTEVVEDYLNGAISAVTVRDIARDGLKLEDGKHDPRMEKRIVSILQQLKWQPYKSGSLRKWARP